MFVRDLKNVYFMVTFAFYNEQSIKSTFTLSCCRWILSYIIAVAIAIVIINITTPAIVLQIM